MRLPIVYANTAVRVLEIIGANVASLIVIITSNVVIELDLTSLPRCNGSKSARKRSLPTRRFAAFSSLFPKISFASRDYS